MIYGNPSYKSVERIKDSILLREWTRLGVFEPLKDMMYPNEQLTQGELWYMVHLQNNLDSARLDRCNQLDEKLYEAMAEFIGSYGVTVSADQVEQELDVYDPIIHYLKAVYNRPRPFQVAGTLNIPLYPRLISSTSHSASYPSGHTLLALFFRHIYMQRHPELSKELMRFVIDVKRSREEGGVHYPSDGVFSIKIYQHLAPWIDARSNIYSQGLDKITGY